MKTKSSSISAFINRRVLVGFVICLAGLALGFFAFVARATPPNVITVNTLVDETTTNGLCSLREAITNANDNAQTYPDCAAGTGADAITFSVSGTITLSSTLPSINDDLRIDGGAQSIIISGGNSVGVMVVNNGKTVTLHNLTIANGAPGLDNLGTVNVTNITFSSNSAGLGDGGGIFNSGTVNVINSTFSGNSAGDGGGISNNGGTVNVTNSTFSGNRGTGSGGGGIFSTGAGGTVNVTNSTFFGNTGSVGGGTNILGGTLNVTNSTFSGNSASLANGGGGIITQGTGTTTLKNTIIANSPSGGNCVNIGGGTLNADSHNLADDSTCGSATQATSAQINLQPLANNGGPTQTMALGTGSVAIDAGDETVCAAPPVNEFDQRGVMRPIDGDNDGIAVCDVGAYEAGAAAPTPSPTPTATIPPSSPTPTATIPPPSPTPTATIPPPSPTPTATIPPPSPTPTPTPTPTPISAPLAPTATAATNVTSSSFSANWTGVDGATGYRLDVATASSFTGNSYVSGYHNLDVGNVTSRTVAGLNANTTYYYRVRAYNNAGNSRYSNVISVTTSP